jgi:hypothetical protein
VTDEVTWKITSRAQILASRTPASRRQPLFHFRVLELLFLEFSRPQTDLQSQFLARIGRLLPPFWRDLPAVSSHNAYLLSISLQR